MIGRGKEREKRICKEREREIEEEERVDLVIIHA